MTPGELFALICGFNFHPAAYLHPSHRPWVAGNAHDARIWSCDRSLSHLSRQVLADLAQPPFMDAAFPAWRVALLENSRLARVAVHLTALLVGPQVRRAVRRDDVLAWREWLTPEAHEFAMRAAGLLPAARLETEASRDGDPAAPGFACLAAAAAEWPEPVRARFGLKLPAGMAPLALAPSAARRVVQFVLPVVERNWCSSFALKTA